MNELRVDKWLWTVRIFKTRALATRACKNKRVRIGERVVKPSALVQVGDTVHVRKPPVTFSFRVLAITPSRVGPKLVPNFIKNVTPPEEYQILKIQRAADQRRKGLGRPTKKERRDLENFFTPGYDDDEWDELDDLDDGDDPDEGDGDYSPEDEQEVLDSMGFWD